MSKCVRCGNELLTGDVHYEMGLCNKCYNELYTDHKSHISLDKMWLEIANNFRNDNEKLQERIAGLEAKLAESEENIKILEEDRIIMNKTMELYVNKCENYEQQLAEKEKAIENYEKFTSVPLVEMTKMYEQDKIDFAVEQLERVKKYISEHKRFVLRECEIDEMIEELRNGK